MTKSLITNAQLSIMSREAQISEVVAGFEDRNGSLHEAANNIQSVIFGLGKMQANPGDKVDNVSEMFDNLQDTFEFLNNLHAVSVN